MIRIAFVRGSDREETTGEWNLVRIAQMIEQLREYTLYYIDR